MPAPGAGAHLRAGGGVPPGSLQPEHGEEQRGRGVVFLSLFLVFSSSFLVFSSFFLVVVFDVLNKGVLLGGSWLLLHASCFVWRAQPHVGPASWAAHADSNGQ